ncbi:hypothetical protein QBC46DRAFT_268704 [Diplogelasinospora grovesii]|uniref:Uncharacterized protein n=1 Tax=Diplogelasinospora grovesii TaxID=303347 RepID=A0AAN6N0F4_9PEZI|nr:hypothetical protein QBC46DRAFT_268704 [Diplogelasinospora grovesii]
MDYQPPESPELTVPPTDGSNTLSKALEDARKALSQRSDEVAMYKTRWKQLGRELNELRSQQYFSLVTDDDLADYAKTLRANIRSFSIQYFDGPPREKLGRSDVSERAKRSPYLRGLTETEEDLYKYLMSPDDCPSIIQAYLWTFIVKRVFDKFCWAGDLSTSLNGLCKVMRPGWQSDTKLPANPEAERDFQLWSATTTRLLLGSLDTSEGSETDRVTRQARERLVTLIDSKIGPFRRNREGGFKESLDQILTDATEFDREISRQAARVRWVFPERTRLSFDPDIMEQQTGKPQPERDQRVSLVIAPALKKRGKSNGEGFKGPESWLLPALVSCDLLDEE